MCVNECREHQLTVYYNQLIDYMFNNNLLIDYNIYTIDNIIYKLNDLTSSQIEKDKLLINPIFDKIKKEIKTIIEKIDEIFTENILQLGGDKNINIKYKQKYLKYKQKYLELKKNKI